MAWISILFWLVGTLAVVLGPIILIHELGHFIMAKLAGVRVEEFGLGYPPRMLKLWRGKGYLKIGDTRVNIPTGFRIPAGLEAEKWVDATVTRRDEGAYRLQRLKVLDPTVDDLTPQRESVDSADEDVHVRGLVTALERGTLYSLNWLPMGGFVRLTGEEDPSDPRSLAAQPKRWRVAVLTAGPLLNIITAILLLVGAYTAGYPDKWLVEVTRIEPGSVAEEIGIQPHDVIQAAGGERLVQGQEQLQRIIRAAPEQAVELTILRGKETVVLTATPKRTTEGYGRLGIWMAPWPDRSALRRYGLLEALNSGLSDTVAAIAATAQAPARLAQGEISPQEARPASMVGISGVLAFSLKQSIEWGLAFPALQTASLISLALGLTNLLPLPALDGGRILFILVEAVRGRRISPEREAMVHLVGMLVLISLMALVMLHDVINPIIPWSWLR